MNISDELVKYYKNKIKDIRKKEVQLDDDDEQNTVEEKREILIQKKNNIEKIIKQLKMECRRIISRVLKAFCLQRQVCGLLNR